MGFSQLLTSLQVPTRKVVYKSLLLEPHLPPQEAKQDTSFGGERGISEPPGEEDLPPGPPVS